MNVDFDKKFKISQAVESVQNVVKVSTTRKNEYEDMAKAFADSSFVSWKVSAEFITSGIDRIDALKGVHRALAEIQELRYHFLDVVKFKAELKDIDAMRDALYLNIVTSPELLSMFKTKTDRESYTKKLLINLDLAITTVSNNVAIMDKLSRWVFEQLDALNKLDSALRLETTLRTMSQADTGIPISSESISAAVDKVKID